MTKLTQDTRGVSQAVGYVLALGVITILITSLLIGVSGFLTTETERAQRQAFEVVGQQIAADVEATDAYILQSSGDDEIVRVIESPSRIAASNYNVEISQQSGTLYEIRLYNRDGISVPVTVRSYTPLEETTVNGGDIRIRYDTAQNKVIFNG